MAGLQGSAMTANNETIDPNPPRRHQFLFSFGAEQKCRTIYCALCDTPEQEETATEWEPRDSGVT